MREPGPRDRLLLLGGLYLAQGLPYGFFTQALPVALRKAGTSLEEIGLASLLALPWMGKFLWAPLVDRTLTPRRWILGLQAAAVLLVSGLAWADPASGGLKLLAVGVFLTNLVAATQDVPTDGLAVRILPEAERGLANGLQVGAYRAGMILGGGVLLIAWERLGWRPALVGMACLLALSSLPLLRWREVGAVASSPRDGRDHPWDWLHLPGAGAWLVVLALFKTGDHLAQGMIRPWMVDRAFTEGEIGAMLGIGGFLAGLLGAVGGGAAVPKLGLTHALVLAGCLQMTGPMAYAAAEQSGAAPAAVMAAAFWDHFAGGTATAALFTAMMFTSRPTDAGTDYTLQASVVVGASGIGAGLSGLIAGRFGYEATFLVGAAVAALAPLLVWTPWARQMLDQRKG